MGKYYKWAFALIAPLLLAGCLLVPGKFESQLLLMNDGTYSFTYNGQMQLADEDDSAMSSPDSMTDDDSSKSRTKDDEQKNAAMRSVFGGMVPGDDEGLTKFAAQLAKYDGWNKVEYMGNNLFEVEYAVSGNFDQMFAFPTLPGATMQFPFVQIIRRNGGEIEILTPAMAGPGGLAGAMGPMPIGDSGETMEPIDGNFTIETDGEVLSNNSVDGYSISGAMKNLYWKVDEASSAGRSPRAIIKLNR
ncbi:hypothetical protein [Parasphingorhabdus sp.]|uniref:hypothetical protein n=1 Tax=Parasphingorhabdus sp. TaxID=2709688 RepID=UPI003A943B15